MKCLTLQTVCVLFGFLLYNLTNGSASALLIREIHCHTQYCRIIHFQTVEFTSLQGVGWTPYPPPYYFVFVHKHSPPRLERAVFLPLMYVYLTFNIYCVSKWSHSPGTAGFSCAGGKRIELYINTVWLTYYRLISQVTD